MRVEWGRCFGNSETGGGGEKVLDDPGYVQFRREQLGRAGKIGYPNKFPLDTRIRDTLRDFGHLEKGQARVDKVVSVAGRVGSIREAGKNLSFIDITSEEEKIQIKAQRSAYSCRDSFSDDVHVLRRGDVIGVKGHPLRTKAGELSLSAHKVVLLSPCLRKMLNYRYDFDQKEIRFRRRWVDFIANPERKKIFRDRAKVIRAIRR